MQSALTGSVLCLKFQHKPTVKVSDKLLKMLTADGGKVNIAVTQSFIFLNFSIRALVSPALVCIPEGCKKPAPTSHCSQASNNIGKS